MIELLKKHGATGKPPQTMLEKWRSMSPEEREEYIEQARKRLEAMKKQETKE
jgi:hypothetical protein